MNNYSSCLDVTIFSKKKKTPNSTFFPDEPLLFRQSTSATAPSVTTNGSAVNGAAPPSQGAPSPAGATKTDLWQQTLQAAVRIPT